MKNMTLNMEKEVLLLEDGRQTHDDENIFSKHISPHPREIPRV